MYDDDANVLQEFKSSADLTTEWVTHHKESNKHLKIDTSTLGKRSNMPRNNCIEESVMHDVLLGYKRFKPQ